MKLLWRILQLTIESESSCNNKNEDLYYFKSFVLHTQENNALRHNYSRLQFRNNELSARDSFYMYFFADTQVQSRNDV